MKEHPILFTDPMVRAILSGAKTQTRRVVKPQPVPGGIGYFGPGIPFIRTGSSDVRCPYGQPGDRLWVREAFALSVIDPDGPSPEDDPENYDVIYRADPELPGGGWTDSGGKEIPPPWKPSIHMPRWACRLELGIAGIRVERLNDISEADAKAEGAQPLCIASDISAAEIALLDLPMFERDNPYRNGFSTLWESINGPGSWDANPWVWVIEFKRA